VPAPASVSIVFIGFMGAGKSAAARGATRVLGGDPIDTDELIAAEIGGSIASHFRDHGEASFREIEERVVLAALERGGIVALGGGAVESERVRAALAEHVTAWCRVEEPTAWERCRGSDRPLARDRDGFGRRFDARLPLYEGCARVVLPAGGEEIGAAAAPWLDALRGSPGIRMCWSRTASGQGPALVGPGATKLIDARPELRPGARLFALADRAALAAAGGLMPAVEGEPIGVEGGEAAKTVAAAESALRELARAGVRREDAIVAFGGGVAGDLAGFCAAVYQRGVAVVQVPTTLVAQVDSAYGGKTGVDLPEGKNYVGSFHQPAAVLTDPEALATLPAVELAAGFAEVVKTALIAGGSLWERVRELDRVDAAAVSPLIFDCARVKLDVVAADERESGRRAVLNLGHTIGHAIEAATGYGRYRHGEAIAIGLVAAVRLSGAATLEGEVRALLERAGLPVALDPDVDVDAVLDAAGRDKKRTGAGIGFVLVSSPGEVEFGQPVEDASLRRVVEDLSAR